MGKIKYDKALEQFLGCCQLQIKFNINPPPLSMNLHVKYALSCLYEAQGIILERSNYEQKGQSPCIQQTVFTFVSGIPGGPFSVS